MSPPLDLSASVLPVPQPCIGHHRDRDHPAVLRAFCAHRSGQSLRRYLECRFPSVRRPGDKNTVKGNSLSRKADKSALPVLSFPPGESAMTDPNCLFCSIIRGKIPSQKVYEDDHIFAFEDIHPQAPTHVLIIPKRHFAGLKEAEAADAEIIGRCHLAAAQIARQRKIEHGYRTVLNVGPGAGQSVFHLHVHLLGGRPLTWPPG